MDIDLVDIIKKFDLSTYESKVYITLNSLISGTAEEIAREANIPKSKSYEVLKNLSRKKFIEIKGGKPIIYEVIPPKKAFGDHRKELIKKLFEAENKMIDIYENNVSQVQAPIWLIPTEEKIIEKEIDLIKRANSSINMRIGFLTEKELKLLIKTFKNIKPSIEIKILTTEECVINNKKVNIVELFERERIDNLKIEIADIPFVKLIIKDKDEMFHIYAQQNEKTKESNLDTFKGVWNRYKDVSKNYYERYEKQFKRIEKMSKKNKIR